MLDIDHFKKFNDTHGHLLGNQVQSSLSPACLTDLHQGATDTPSAIWRGGVLRSSCQHHAEGAIAVAQQDLRNVATKAISAARRPVKISWGGRIPWGGPVWRQESPEGCWSAPIPL